MIAENRKSLIRLHHDESGTAMIEYSILLGLIAVAIDSAWSSLWVRWVTNQWSNLSTYFAAQLAWAVQRAHLCVTARCRDT